MDTYNLVSNKTFLLAYLLISFNFFSQSINQDVMSNGGETYNQINGSVQFNIGEPIVETYANPDSPQMYLGFEQGSYSLVSVEENKPIDNLTVELFPNPSSGIFSIDFLNDNPVGFNYYLTDNLGKVIIEPTKIINRNTLIDLSIHQRGIYLLMVLNQELEYSKTFKLLKQ